MGVQSGSSSSGGGGGGGGVQVEGLESLAELVDYLRNPNPQVRAMGAQVALAVTATEEGRRGLVEAQALPTLCRLSGDTHRVAEPAVSALTNLCADELPQVVEELLRRGIVDRLVETVTSDECGFRDLALMLLANVSATEQGAKRMMQVEDDDDEEEEEAAAAATAEKQQQQDGQEPQPEQEQQEQQALPQEKEKKRSALQGLHVRRLLRRFLGGYDPAAEEDEWQHVASVLHNVSQLQEGRDLLRRRQTDILRMLLPQLQSSNPVRRRGVASALRNCCFEEGDHFYLLQELEVIPHLLYPIMGPASTLDEEEQAAVDPLVLQHGEAKRLEPEADIRTALYETILLFCSTRQSREALRKRGVYPVLREADKAESSEENSEVIYKIVNFLQRDETPLPGAASNSSTAGTPAMAITEGLNEVEDAPLDAEGAALPVPLSDVKEREALAMASLRATLDDLD